MADVEEPWRAVFQTPAHARRTSTADFLPVQRVEMQSGLSLLLVVRQQREGHDGADGKKINRLATWIGQPLPRADGRRTVAPAEVHSQDRLLRFEKRFHRLSPHEWPPYETGRDRPVGRCRIGRGESCGGLYRREAGSGKSADSDSSILRVPHQEHEEVQ